MSFAELLRNEEHEKIALLSEEEFNPFKAIAYIHLGRYAEALKCARKGSFETAYILYKLKKYKKALRILRRLSDERSRVLTSQCLYYLGYYNTAYKILSEFARDDETVVNLQAMKSLALLADKSRAIHGKRFSIAAKDRLRAFEDLDKHRFVAPELGVDFVFNKAFEYLDEEHRFVDYLERKLDADPALGNTVVEEQLKNVRKEFDAVETEMLNKNQRETLAFNTGKIKEFAEPVHYQKNVSRIDLTRKMLSSNDTAWLNLVYELGLLRGISGGSLTPSTSRSSFS
jgi:tetratricopeptide (TPR) repeat protein